MPRTIDVPEINDNRKYDWTRCEVQEKEEYPLIIHMIEPKSKVMDLGCGNGSLLVMLKEQKDVTAMGIELVKSGVDICRKKGLSVYQGSIDDSAVYSDIKDKAFDYAICTETIQMVMYPEVLLGEMRRIATFQIVAFPNFACWRNRIDLLVNGRMPRPMLGGYEWYNTGHIHQLSICDFRETCEKLSLEIVRAVFLPNRARLKLFLCRIFPNLFARAAIFMCKARRE